MKSEQQRNLLNRWINEKLFKRFNSNEWELEYIYVNLNKQQTNAKEIRRTKNR